jgi:small subunit ribosomal protein S3
MGQKIHPTGFRLAVTRNWNSRWYANNRDFSDMLAEDIKVREYLKTKLKNAAVSRVLIERPAKNARITIYSARPGVVIGKKGEDIENLKKELATRLGVPVAVNIEEVRKPEVDAQLIADSITQQLEKRIMFRRAMKRAMQNAMRLGAQGIKIMSSGRLNGIEIARPSGTAKAVCRCTRCARTSTTASPKPRPPTASSASRCGSTRATPWAATTCRPWTARRVPRAKSVVARVARAVTATAVAAPAVTAVAVLAGGRGGPRTGVSAGAGNVAPADGSDKPQEATAGAPEAPKSTVKRVPRKTGCRAGRDSSHRR